MYKDVHVSVYVCTELYMCMNMTVSCTELYMCMNMTVSCTELYMCMNMTVSCMSICAYIAFVCT